jgi:hypothetical protein
MINRPHVRSSDSGYIIGAMRIDRTCNVDACAGTPAAAWASGPVCNVIGAIVELDEPITHRGALGLWPIDAAVRDRVRTALEGHPILENEPSQLPPSSAPPASPAPRQQRRQQGHDQRKRKRSGSTSNVPDAHGGGQGTLDAAFAKVRARHPADLPDDTAGPLRPPPSLPAAALLPPSLDKLVSKMQSIVPGLSAERARDALVATGYNLVEASYAVQRGA